MEELLRSVMESVALGVEAGATLFIAIGALEAMYLVLRRISPYAGDAPIRKKQIWVRFATWLVLALEFELAADVLRTAISPTWDAVGQLASIAAIRTGLNYFLERDIEKYGRAEPAR